MKKSILLLAIALLGFKFAGAQGRPDFPMDAEKKKILFTEVVQLPGTAKDKLYERAVKSVKIMYKEAEKRMTMNDKATGVIEMRCSTALSLKDKKTGLMTQEGYFLYKLRLAMKDGRYKYEFYDFHQDRGGYKIGLEKLMEPDQTKPADRLDEKLNILHEDITKHIATLKENMASDKTTVKEDW